VAEILTKDQLEDLTKVMRIFLPYAFRNRDRVKESKARFVHYTSAENALNIINSKCIWMLNTNCMADYREVNHGLDALRGYFAGDHHKEAFTTALNGCAAGLAEEAVAIFDRLWQGTQSYTYITSISEHEDEEDLHGRLSMWRAFGNTSARVAIVLNLSLEIGKNAALACELSPVGYFTDKDVAQEFSVVVKNVSDNQDFLRGVDRKMLLGSIVAMLTSAVVCLKHEGFREEREWRVIYSPTRVTSPHIETSTVVLGGFPQRIFKIPLRNNSEAGISGVELDDLVDRIIIGPSQFPGVMYEAFVTALEAAGVKDAARRVVASQIPVRT
jgi:hypothetical protein